MTKIASSAALVLLATALLPWGATAAPAAFLDKPQADIEAGELASAEIRLKDRLQRDSTDMQARLLLADIYLKRREGLQAEQEIERALEGGLDRSAALEPLARALLVQGAAQRVIDEIEVPEDLPAGPKARLLVLRGEAFDMIEDRWRAASAFEDARRLDVGNASAALGLARLAVAENEPAKARALIDEALELDPTHATAWEMRGELAYRDGDREAAAKAFSQAVVGDPTAWTAYFKRATVRLDLRDSVGAEQDLSEVARNNPRFPGLDLLRGRLLLAEGKPEQAAEPLERYTQAMPGDAQGYYLAAQAMARLDRRQAAKTYIDKYIGLAPKNLGGALPAADLLLRIGEAAAAQALIEPHAGESRVGPADEILAAALEAQGRIGQALPVVRRLAAEAPKEPRHQQRLARLLARSGDWKGMRDAARRLTALTPDALPSRLILVEALIRAGSADEARREATALVERFPSEARAHQALGVALVAAGELETGKAALVEALQLDPSLDKAAVTLARLEAATGDVEAARAVLGQIEGADAPEIVREVAALDRGAGDLPAAVARLRTALSAAPGDVPLRMELAATLVKLDDAPGGLAVLRDAPESAQTASLLRLRGLLERRLGDPAAVLTYRRLAALVPNDPPVRLLLLDAYAAAGRFDELMDALPAALKVVGSSPAAAPMLTAIHGRLPTAEQRQLFVTVLGRVAPGQAAFAQLQGQFSYESGELEADTYFRTARQAAPQWREPVSGLVAALARAGRTAEAVAAAHEWLAGQPEDVQLRLELATLHLRTQELPQALAQYREILSRQPDQPVALNNLAMLTLEQDPSGALALARRVVEQEPENSMYVDTLGAALLRTDGAEEAKTLLADAHRRNPGDPTLAYRFASALAQTGDMAEARRVLLEIVEKPFGEQAEAQALLQQIGTSAPAP